MRTKTELFSFFGFSVRPLGGLVGGRRKKGIDHLNDRSAELAISRRSGLHSFQSGPDAGASVRR